MTPQKDKPEFTIHNFRNAMEGSEIDSVQKVEQLINDGADVNVQHKNYEFTPLNIAASHGKLEVVKLLIKHGANAAYVDRDNHTVLHNAARRSNLEIIKFLVENGADPHIIDTNGHSLLHSVINGVDLRCEDLHRRKECLQTIEFLVSLGGMEKIFGKEKTPIDHAKKRIDAPVEQDETTERETLTAIIGMLQPVQGLVRAHLENSTKIATATVLAGQLKKFVQQQYPDDTEILKNMDQVASKLETELKKDLPVKEINSALQKGNSGPSEGNVSTTFDLGDTTVLEYRLAQDSHPNR